MITIIIIIIIIKTRKPAHIVVDNGAGENIFMSDEGKVLKN